MFRFPKAPPPKLYGRCRTKFLLRKQEQELTVLSRAVALSYFHIDETKGEPRFHLFTEIARRNTPPDTAVDATEGVQALGTFPK
jgi:hypothetical protein